MAARQSVTQGAAVATRFRAAADAILTREHKAASRAINSAFAIEAPFAGVAKRVGDLAEPLLIAIQESKKPENRIDPKDIPLYVPNVPHILPVTRLLRDNALLRDVLVHDSSKPAVKPRLSWYHPDDTMVPRGWFQEGLMMDFEYYFSKEKSTH